MKFGIKKHRPSATRVGIGLAITAALLVPIIAAGCGNDSGPGASEKKDQLIIYSGRKEKLFLPVVKKFEEKTGIEVSIKNGKTAELASAIIEEAGNPRADIFLAQEAGMLDRLRVEKVLEPYKPENFEKIPAEFRSPDGSWTGVSGRARVIIYNEDMVKPNELPDSVFDLTDPKWKGKIAMAASTEASVIGWISSLRLQKGEKFVRDFLTDLKKNDIEVLENHTLVAKAVGKGEFAFGFVNHYYYHIEKNKSKTPVNAIYPDQGTGDVGVLVNTSGVAILKGAKNQEAAKKFVDFLITPEAQDQFASSNYEYPTIPDVPAHEAKPLSEFKRANVDLKTLGKEVDKTLDLLNELGFD